ncbi:hypothetical protein [Dyella silvatica]|uniref:hypothetical protein n=1 Tax=Dyella silvatica TaxID=2992128 RepID=UPI002253ECC8|nr:hypothetical protein [Dyella silvatica]
MAIVGLIPGDGLIESLGAKEAESLIKIPLWSSTKNKSAVANAFGHWMKHAGEFSEFQNAKEYVEGARNFLTYPPAGALTKVRSNGDTLIYDAATNTFGSRAASGAPRTMFRPQDGIDYWNRQ